MYEIIQQFSVPVQYRVMFTHGVFKTPDTALSSVRLQADNTVRHRILPIIDSGVLEAWPGLPAQIRTYADDHAELIELVCDPFIIRGGEVCKNDPVEVVKIHEMIESYGLCRHSFLLVIGGGTVLDAAGYAAATAHRGIRIIRMPTTVLAQNDSGMGVKNGVNFRTRKNFIGTFAAPYAVINDFDYLDTLEDRDKRAGIAEAVKIGVIRDRRFFDTLEADKKRLAGYEPAAMEAMIVSCAELHIAHIRDSGDPYESGSSRPLDFGHWLAHKLEELTGNALRHGEAVAVGIAVDSIYSNLIGSLTTEELERIISLLVDVGFELHESTLNELDIGQALAEFQEHLGGALSITLLSGIGASFETGSIDKDIMAQSIECLLTMGA